MGTTVAPRWSRSVSWLERWNIEYRRCFFPLLCGLHGHLRANQSNEQLTLAAFTPGNGRRKQCDVLHDKTLNALLISINLLIYYYYLICCQMDTDFIYLGRATLTPLLVWVRVNARHRNHSKMKRSANSDAAAGRGRKGGATSGHCWLPPANGADFQGDDGLRRLKRRSVTSSFAPRGWGPQCPPGLSWGRGAPWPSTVSSWGRWFAVFISPWASPFTSSIRSSPRSPTPWSLPSILSSFVPARSSSGQSRVTLI